MKAEPYLKGEVVRQFGRLRVLKERLDETLRLALGDHSASGGRGKDRLEPSVFVLE